MTKRTLGMGAVLALAATLTACGDADTRSAANDTAVAARPTPAAEVVPAPGTPPTPLPLAAPSGRADGAAAFVADGGGWTPILYLCDGVDGSQAVAASRSRLWTFAKPRMDLTTRPITLGGEDAGAGSIWRDLIGDGATVGAVRSINPGMLGPPAATTLPTLSSVRIGTRETRCRWLPAARLLIVTATRSAVVTREPDGSYTYRSFDFARPGTVSDGGEAGTSSTPTVEVRGGRLVAGPAGSESYAFAAAPWTYRVTASARTSAPGASITVLKDGRQASRAAAIAYEMAAARID